MAGVTDLGMRRVAQRFGASMTVSEMVVGEYLARAKPPVSCGLPARDSFRMWSRSRAVGPKRLAEGARIAEASGAVAIDINMGCPAKKVTGGLAGSALMRDLDAATRLIAATVAAVKRPGHGQDAVGLGHGLSQRARSCGPGRAGRCRYGHGAWSHPQPVLQGAGRLGRRRGGQAGGVDPRGRQWRLRFARRCRRPC